MNMVPASLSEGSPGGGFPNDPLEQRYLANPNPLDPNGAYTFIAYDQGLPSHRFTVGTYLFNKKLDTFSIRKSLGMHRDWTGSTDFPTSEFSVVAEAGVATEHYTLTNGWDHPWSYEYSGGIEVYQKQPVTKWGVTGGINVQLLDVPSKAELAREADSIPTIIGISGGVSFEYYDKNSYSVRFNLLAIPLGWKF